MRSIMNWLQPLGGALLLPIAALPIAGLLLRLGQPDLLNLPFIAAAGDAVSHCIHMPACDPFVQPIVASIAVQLLAYHTACEKGTDVDQPRNLAKSVTVE